MTGSLIWTPKASNETLWCFQNADLYSVSRDKRDQPESFSVLLPCR